jgi:Histidine kinase-like ATPase domain
VATVELSFVPRPAHVRTARQVAVALARRAGLGDDILDEVRLAVAEACGLALALQRRNRPDDPVVLVFDDDAGLTVDVRTSAPLDPASGDHALSVLAAAVPRPAVMAEELPVGASLAVLAEVAPRLAVTTSAAGLRLELGWPPVAVANR